MHDDDQLNYFFSFTGYTVRNEDLSRHFTKDKFVGMCSSYVNTTDWKVTDWITIFDLTTCKVYKGKVNYPEDYPEDIMDDTMKYAEGIAKMLDAMEKDTCCGYAKHGSFIGVTFDINVDEHKVSFGCALKECANFSKEYTEFLVSQMDKNVFKSLIELDRKVKALMYGCDISLANSEHYHLIGPGNHHLLKGYPINSEELRVWQEGYYEPLVDWRKLIRFPELTKLTVVTYGMSGFSQYARSNCLQHLVIIGHTGASPTTFDWLPRFPNLESIDTKEIPNLTNILDFLPKCPKIKRIRIHTASPALTRYCVANGIDLE